MQGNAPQYLTETLTINSYVHQYCTRQYAPQYLTETLTINSNVHQYCTRQSNELHLPLAKTNSMKKTFQYMAYADFNSLPTLAQLRVEVIEKVF